MNTQDRIAAMEAEADARILQLSQGNTEKSTTSEIKDTASETLDKPTSQEQQPQEQPKAEPEKQSNQNTWEERYRILQGKYNKEIGDFRSRVQQLEQQAQQSNSQHLEAELTQKNQRIAELEKQLESSGSTDNTPNDYLVSEFGDEFDKAVAKKAEEIAGKMVDAKFSEMDQKYSGKFQQHETQTNEQKLSAMLSAKGVDMAQTDSDPLFTEWLNETEEYSGKTKLSLLRTAFQQGDLPRVAKFFLDYSNQQPKQQEKSNPLLDSVSHHDDSKLQAPDDYTQGKLSPEQVGDLIAKNEEDFVRKRISTKEYEENERKYFAMLN